MGESQISSLLKGCYCHFAGDAWKVLEEFVQGISGLKEIQQRLERHPCACEARCAAHYVWNAEDGGFHGVNDSWPWIPTQTVTLPAHNVPFSDRAPPYGAREL
jgi:hypothetical protein